MNQTCLVMVSNSEYYVSHKVFPVFEDGKFKKKELELVTTPDIFNATFRKGKSIFNIRKVLSDHGYISCEIKPFMKKVIFQLYDNHDGIRFNKRPVNTEELFNMDINPTDYRKSGTQLFDDKDLMIKFCIERNRHYHELSIKTLNDSIERFEKMINVDDYKHLLREIDISTLIN